MFNTDSLQSNYYTPRVNYQAGSYNMFNQPSQSYRDSQCPVNWRYDAAYTQRSATSAPPNSANSSYTSEHGSSSGSPCNLSPLQFNTIENNDSSISKYQLYMMHQKQSHVNQCGFYNEHDDEDVEDTDEDYAMECESADVNNNTVNSTPITSSLTRRRALAVLRGRAFRIKMNAWYEALRQKLDVNIARSIGKRKKLSRLEIVQAAIDSIRKLELELSMMSN
jgi:hypothetical protein